MRSLRGIFLTLALVVGTAAAASAGPWPAWLDWLFGERLRSRPAVERSEVSRRLVCPVPATAGACPVDLVLAISERYTVNWTPDGKGPIDTLYFTASTAGNVQAPSVSRVPAPAFPQSFTVVWQDPAIGDSITTGACAAVKRRKLTSAQVCSAPRKYITPDTPPPPPSIDTTLSVAAIVLKPDSVRLAPAAAQQFCLFVRFRGGAVPADRVSAPAYCGSNYAAWFAPSETIVSPAQQARADSIYLGLTGIAGVPNTWRGLTLAAAVFRPPAAANAWAEARGGL